MSGKGPGKGQMEEVPGVGDRIAALLRRHASIHNASALARAAGVSRETMNRALNHDTLTRPTAMGIARALGITTEQLLGEQPVFLAVGEQVESFNAPEARHARTMPLKLRIYLDELRLRLTKGGAEEEEIERALAVLRSPSLFTYYSVGTPKELPEEKVLQAMKAIAEHFILPDLRSRGRKV
jgi:plasmid maintenance system antidote protein VapI